jgi:hypothetical protein
MSEEQESPNRVECPAANDPGVRMFIVAAMCIGFAVWYYLDSNKAVPKHWDWEHVSEVAGYVTNAIMPYVLAPIGLLMIIWGIVYMGRKLIADDEGIGYDGKQKIRWNEFKKMDAAKLKKGLLYLYYGPDEKKLTLDSWKLKNYKQLIEFVEAHLPRELLKQA